MSERACPGLPADWFNGWLAAVGATALVPDLRLRWTDDPLPLAVLSAPSDADPADLIAAAWPERDDMATWPMARHLSGLPELSLNPDVDTWGERARSARAGGRSWMMTSLFTDLSWSHKDKVHDIDRGQFYVGMPAGRTLHERLERLVEPTTSGAVAATLDGAGRRVSAYGLGFDVTRIGSLADDAKQLVDPVVEVLAFFGLALFPTRGDGFKRRQRGWQNSTLRAGSLQWVTWSPELDRHAVDALFDLALTPRRRQGLPVTSRWENLPYAARADKDLTRGIGSRRVR